MIVRLVSDEKERDILGLIVPVGLNFLTRATCSRTETVEQLTDEPELLNSLVDNKNIFLSV